MNKTHAPYILLVEDSAMDVELTRRAFECNQLAPRIEVARDGEEALGWLDRWDQGTERPALVLLDLNLPRIDGLEVLRTIKGQEAHRAVPIVVLSTSNAPQDIQRAYEHGANSYIVKPVDFVSFVGAIGQLHAYWMALNERSP